MPDSPSPGNSPSLLVRQSGGLALWMCVTMGVLAK